MCSIHDTFSALGFSFLPLIIHSHRKGLIICKKKHICPFFNQWGGLGTGLFSKLQFPPVIGSQFIRLFKFADLGMGRQNNIDTCFHYFGKPIQKTSHLFFYIHITVSVTEIFNSRFLMLITNVFDTQRFRPVYRINNKCFHFVRMAARIFNFIQNHLPACRLRESGQVH